MSSVAALAQPSSKGFFPAPEQPGGQSLPENAYSPCARIFAVCILSSTRQKKNLPCDTRQTTNTRQPCSLPCANPQAHGEHGSRGSHADSAVRGLTAVIVCRVPESDTRRTQIFAVCHMAGTRRTWFSRLAPSEPFLFAVCPGWHTANMDICRVPGPRRTAKIMFVVWLSPAHGKHEKNSCFCFQIFSTLFIFRLVL